MGRSSYDLISGGFDINEISELFYVANMRSKDTRSCNIVNVFYCVPFGKMGFLIKMLALCL